jgi:APA family basic amino acid/polyamine antiporter
VRGLGARDVSFLTFSSVVGSAIFIAAAIAPREVPQPAVMMGLWTLAGLLTLAGAVTYAELGTMYPEAGGQYHYLKAAYGPLYGFLFGWTSFLVMQAGRSHTSRSRAPIVSARSCRSSGRRARCS